MSKSVACVVAARTHQRRAESASAFACPARADWTLCAAQEDAAAGVCMHARQWTVHRHIPARNASVRPGCGVFFWPAREGARHCEGARVWGLCMRLARQKNTQWRMPEPFESHVSCLARGRKTSLNNPAPLLHTLCRVRRRPSGSNGSESPPTRATPCTRVHRCKGGTLAPAQSLGALKQQQVSASLSPRPSSPRDTAKMHSPATTCVHTLRGDAPRAG